MAVDAKDQVTHGHIRRVQAYAVGLARALAVSDPGMIKAIEASALLHDMGKLAIPEHILNKPGKLSDAEFAKIQMHVTIGADLLSAIAFPFPVIPIVRHHHENWDGRGYPIGLTGTQIPIGARILAVVDCYDALTSDRPYRPRLSDEAATAILLQRRGSMYDPLVVDTFVRVHRSFARPEALSAAQSDTYADIARLSAPIISQSVDHVFNNSTSVSSIVSDLLSWSIAHGHTASISERRDAVLSILLKALTAKAGLIAEYDQNNDDLVVTTSQGFGEAEVVGRRIQLGEHLSGWVAANGRPMLNANAALDLAALVSGAAPTLKTCLSVPLYFEAERLAGVLSLYSVDRFTNDQLDATTTLASAITNGVFCPPPGSRGASLLVKASFTDSSDAVRVSRAV
jgi:putative nucleotidyltransferase with HDIG domain